MRLHAEAELEGLDDTVNLVRRAGARREVAIHRLKQIELAALLTERFEADDVRHLTARAQSRSLVGGGEEGAAVVLRAAEAGGGIDRDEAGEILIRRSQSVEHPRAHRRADEGGAAGMELDGRLRVGGVVGVHAVDHAHFIGVLGNVGEELADPESAGTVLFKLEWRAEEHAALGGFAAVLLELRLIVKGIDVRRAALHEEHDHALGLGLEMRRLRRERIEISRFRLRAGGAGIGRRLLGAQPGQCQIAKTAA